MPTETRIQIPFLPQTGETNSILQAIQMANERHLQQQQIGLQQQIAPSTIAKNEADAAYETAQTEMQRMTLDLRRSLIGALTGTTPGAQPTQAPAPQNPADVIRGATAGQPAAPVAPKGGMIGQVVSDLSQTPGLSDTQRNALKAAGTQAFLMSYLDPTKALDGVTSTFNDIMNEQGQTERTIKTEVRPDSNSPTGYSTVATSANGKQAYSHPSPPPMPTNLEESSAFLGRAQMNYKAEPTDGNKSALDLAQKQHDAMYKDRLAQEAETARVSAQARGADYEAMLRTGTNPITKEPLTIANAPPSALVNPANGQVIPQDMLNVYKPTQQERQTADTARQVLAISKDLQDEVAKNPNLIGPLAGRSQQGLQELGLSAYDASRMIDNVNFLTSAATKMHTGRFSAQILEKMEGILKPGMNPDEFAGALQSVDDVATRYANEDKLTTVYEWQQRQQFESQAPQGGAAAPAPPKVGATQSYQGATYKFDGTQWVKQ